jgi:WXG100 family type VII secretion target
LAGELNLEPDQVHRLETAIGDTGERAAEVMNRIRESYLSVVGSSWQGGAANAAIRKQEEFNEVWQRLRGILTDLQSGVGGSKKLMMETDADDELALGAIDPAAAAAAEGYGGGGSGMAANFGSRM